MLYIDGRLHEVLSNSAVHVYWMPRRGFYLQFLLNQSINDFLVSFTHCQHHHIIIISIIKKYHIVNSIPPAHGTMHCTVQQHTECLWLIRWNLHTSACMWLCNVHDALHALINFFYLLPGVRHSPQSNGPVSHFLHSDFLLAPGLMKHCHMRNRHQ